MKDNKIILSCLYFLLLSSIAYLFFGPPHYWESISFNTLKKGNELVDTYITEYPNSTQKAMFIQISWYGEEPVGGKIDYSIAPSISNEIDVTIDMNKKKATFDIKSRQKPKGNNRASIITEMNVGLTIEDDVVRIEREVTDETEIIELNDSDLASALNLLFFDNSIDFFKGPTTQYNKYRDNEHTIRYSVMRDINVSQKFDSFCRYFNLKDVSMNVSAVMNISLTDSEFSQFSVTLYNASEKQCYFVNVLDFLMGGLPFDISKYELNFSLYSQ